MIWPPALSQALIGIHHVGFLGTRGEADRTSRAAQMLARALNIRNVIAFVGSGATAERQVKWSDMCRQVVDVIKKPPYSGYLWEEERRLLDSFSGTEGVDDAGSFLGRTDRLLLILGLCDEVFNRASKAAPSAGNAHGRLAEHVLSLITHPIARERHALDLLDTLIQDFGIRRFITTNYDLELERAFDRAGFRPLDYVTQKPVLHDDDDQGAFARPPAWSMSLDSKDVDALARFAVAAPGFTDGVLHLHGRRDLPGSILLTERDYQRLYLADDLPSRTYRETLNLLFGANAILFVGVGMEEADVLRPLRQFVTDRRGVAHERPLFALMPERSERQMFETSRALYSRYGVKVLHYPKSGVAPKRAARDKVTATVAARNALADIKHLRNAWWKSWQDRPKSRQAKFYIVPGSKGRCMVRHFVDNLEQFSSGPSLADVRTSLKDKSVVIVKGPHGSGRGTLGQKLVTDPAMARLFTKRFFATARFSNDVYSIIEGAAQFFAGRTFRDDKDEDAFDVLEAILKKEKHLLVIGGLERFCFTKVLPPVESAKGKRQLPQQVLSVGADAVRLIGLLKSLARAGSRGRVVITSSFCPHELTKHRVSSVGHVTLKPIQTYAPIAGRVGEAAAGDVCKALGGHVYALSILHNSVANLPREQAASLVNDLCTRVTSVDREARASTLVSEAWRHFLNRQTHDDAIGYRRVLQLAALFATPVDEYVLGRCIPPDSHLAKQLPGLLDELVKANLMLSISRAERTDERRVTPHTLMRNMVLRQLGCDPDVPGEGQRFDFSGWSAEVPEIMPASQEGHELTTRSLDQLLSAAEEDAAGTDPDRLRDLIRAAFGILRSRWAATAVPRLGVLPSELDEGMSWPHYDAYQRRLARIINLVRRQDGLKKIEAVSRALYKDELAWLYNELALTAFCQGLLEDAFAFYRESAKLSAAVEVNRPGSRCIEAALGVGLVLLERGRLVRARKHFEQALAWSQSQPDETLQARVRGHLGLLDHLSGHFDASLANYKTAIRVLSRAGNLRGVSIFARHRGDLHRWQRQFKPARRAVERSIAAAEAGRHSELTHHARVTEALLQLAEGKSVSVESLSPTREFARRVGMRRLEWEAQAVQAQIALEEGDVDLAGRLAVQGLGVASGNGMKLRVSGSLIMLGRVSLRRGNAAAAEGLFRSALTLSQRHQNQLLYEKAERLLLFGDHQQGRASGPALRQD